VLRAGDVVILAALALLAVGVIMVNSAGMDVAPGGGGGGTGVGDPSAGGVTFASIVGSKSTVLAGLAMAGLLAARVLPIRAIARDPRSAALAPLLLIASLAALALVYVPGVGHASNGSHRWVLLPGGLTFQPSEIGKWAMPVALAWYATRRAAVMDRFATGLLPALAALGLVAGVVVLEDLGTGALIAAAGSVVLLAAGARLAHFLWLAPIGGAGVALAVIAEPYRVERLMTYANPYANPDGSGYHIIQSLVAIANGEGFGRGLGFGLQKFGYLPEDRTDFLFSIVCEELGVAGALLVLTLYAVLLGALVTVIKRETVPLLKLVALGVTATIGLQAAMNLFVVTGLAPTKGIALPLLSSGGTGWILTCGALGLVCAIDRSQPATEADDAKAGAAVEAKPVRTGLPSTAPEPEREPRPQPQPEPRPEPAFP
jgi:cell division protein FtsW